MNDRAMAIAILCSHLCVGEGVLPLEPREYSDLVTILGERHMSPEELLTFTGQDFRQRLGLSVEQSERLTRLMDRSASLSFEISKYERMGISLLTRADAKYPQKLKQKLKNACPPLFYTAGDLTLLEKASIGYVGSRTVSDRDAEFA